MREAIELANAEVDRVDGVVGPATRIPFLLMKAQGAVPEPTALAKARAEIYRRWCR